MALFQRRPEASSNLPMYSIGLTKTLLVVGLGNPGKEYDKTRHNIGFHAIDELAERQDFDNWVEKKDLKCLLASKTLGDNRIILIKPTTFMNASGEAVQAVMHFFKIPISQVTVVHDELDIPFGQIRMRTGGGSAGHNGIKSITSHIGEDYGRIRIGIEQADRKQQDAAAFVLERFTKDEQADMTALLKESTAILTEYCYGGELLTETRNFII